MPTFKSLTNCGAEGSSVAMDDPEIVIAATVTSPATMPANAAAAPIRGRAPRLRMSAGKELRDEVVAHEEQRHDRLAAAQRHDRGDERDHRHEPARQERHVRPVARRARATR